VATRKGITAAGRRRVDAELTRRGLLLVQGQAEIPSVADLLAGAPVTTRGYSWDYAPAWDLTDELAQRDDVAVVKLFRGRRTLVHRALWAPVATIAARARMGVRARGAHDDHVRVLTAVETAPGIALSDLREQLRLERRTCDRVRRDLDQWLCILGREREDVGYHTHEPAFFPWSTGPIAIATTAGPAADVTEAFAALRQAVDAGSDARLARLFPVARCCALPPATPRPGRR
jgi:hypothetical protein